ncbi:MAG: hypothetical protein JSV52_11235 [Candidatus Zixiibacteriota bacterium]|nr:MAG: hypothetical protein JSV52_11235 [candidate division Zixibacteria bacterium]
MGYALAEAALSLGAETTLISGPTSIQPPGGVKLISVETTAQMHAAVKKEFRAVDCLIMAAAPSDFTPEKPLKSKIKKSPKGLSVSMKPTVDILKDITATKRKKQIVVGFALETDDALPNARRKLKEKNLDMIVVNVPGKETGFEHDTNAVVIIEPRRKPISLSVAPKSQLSFAILDRVASLL